MGVGIASTAVYFWADGSSTSFNGKTAEAEGLAGVYVLIDPITHPNINTGYFINDSGVLSASTGVGTAVNGISTVAYYLYDHVANGGIGQTAAFIRDWNNSGKYYSWKLCHQIDLDGNADLNDEEEGPFGDTDAATPATYSGFYGNVQTLDPTGNSSGGSDHSGAAFRWDGTVDVVLYNGGPGVNEIGIFTAVTGYYVNPGSTLSIASSTGQQYWQMAGDVEGNFSASVDDAGFFWDNDDTLWRWIDDVTPGTDDSGSTSRTDAAWGSISTAPTTGDGGADGQVVYLSLDKLGYTQESEGGGGPVTANAPTLKLKRGAQANLPTLAIGEPGFTTDSYQLYVGSPAGNKLIGGNDFFSLEGTTSGGGINLYEGTDNGSDYVQLKSPDSLAGVTTYTFPASPTNGYFLKTNATGTLSWEEVATSLVEDTTPQLGGDLDLNSNDITGTGNINITGDITASDQLTAVHGNFTGVVTATNVTVGSTDFATLNQNVDNLVTLSGVNVDSVDLGTFTGSTISDNRTLKQALQDLETSLESVSGGGAQASSVSVGSTDADSTHYLTFVDGLNANPTQESIQNDAGITYNPSTNILTVSGSISADVTGDLTGEVNAATFDTDANGQVQTGITTVVQLQIGTLGQSLVGITTILDEDDLSSDSATALATQQSIKAYVDALDLTTSLAGDSGSGSVSTSQTLTISGTANEVNTSVSGQTVTVGLPDTVNITTELDVPTIEVTDIQAKDGTASITITNSTGAVSIADSLTVSGDLYVNGTQTYVNTTQMTVEDTLIELQVVDGGSLSSDTNKDVGLIFNYYTTEALKAAVFWDDSTSRIGIAQSVSESSGVLTVNNDQWATIEVGGLTVSDSVGIATAVITVSGSDRVLQNVLVDCGSF